jgi:hypothetical protein
LHTQSNLYKNCDGDVGRTPCPFQNKALKDGAQLPVTIKEKEEKKEGESKCLEQIYSRDHL